MISKNPEYKKLILRILRLVAGLFMIGLIPALIQPGGILKGYWLVVLPVLGLGFIAWGIWKRKADPILLGCVLSGMGWSAVLISPQFQIVPVAEGSRVFLYALGVGFALTTVLTGLFTGKPRWWALVVAILVILAAMFVVKPPAASPKIWDNVFSLV